MAKRNPKNQIVKPLQALFGAIADIYTANVDKEKKISEDTEKSILENRALKTKQFEEENKILEGESLITDLIRGKLVRDKTKKSIADYLGMDKSRFTDESYVGQFEEENKILEGESLITSALKGKGYDGVVVNRVSKLGKLQFPKGRYRRKLPKTPITLEDIKQIPNERVPLNDTEKALAYSKLQPTQRMAYDKYVQEQRRIAEDKRREEKERQPKTVYKDGYEYKQYPDGKMERVGEDPNYIPGIRTSYTRNNNGVYERVVEYSNGKTRVTARWEGSEKKPYDSETYNKTLNRYSKDLEDIKVNRAKVKTNIKMQPEVVIALEDKYKTIAQNNLIEIYDTLPEEGQEIVNTFKKTVVPKLGITRSDGSTKGDIPKEKQKEVWEQTLKESYDEGDIDPVLYRALLLWGDYNFYE